MRPVLRPSSGIRCGPREAGLGFERVHGESAADHRLGDVPHGNAAAVVDLLRSHGDSRLSVAA